MQKDKRSLFWRYLRWSAIVLAVSALGVALFLSIVSSQSTWLNVLSVILASIAAIFSLFSWIQPFSLFSPNPTLKLDNIAQSLDLPEKPSEVRIGRQQLRSERERRGWSQEEVATTLGVGVKTFSRWERGVTAPSSRHLQKLVEVFGKNPAELGFITTEEPDVSKSSSLTENKESEKATPDLSDHVFLVDEQLPVLNEFYGRRQERNDLLTHIAREGSISIVGPAHIGKTWLIDYLRLFAPSMDDKISIGYVDAALPTCNTVTGFTDEALKSLGLRSFSDRTPDLDLLMKYVHKLQEDQLVILCIDSFDELTRHDEFDRSFFEALRAMAQRDLSLVAASEKPLIDLVSRSTHSSPFFNIFKQIKLAPFSKEDAAEFVKDKGSRAGFTSKEQEYWLKYAQDRLGQWTPLRLQLVGKMLSENKETDKARFSTEDAAYWQHFRAEVNELYKQIVK